jgi:hypothetical protein
MSKRIESRPATIESRPATPDSLHILQGNVTAAAMQILAEAASNSRGDAKLQDRVFFIRCNLPIRQILYKYWGAVVKDTATIERAYTTLQSYSGESIDKRYSSFKRLLITVIQPQNGNEGCVEEDDIGKLFEIFELGRQTIDFSSSYDDMKLLNDLLISICPPECKEFIVLKSIQSLYYWYQEHKHDLFYVKKELPNVCFSLFQFIPQDTGKIYLLLSSSLNSFVHEAFKESLTFGENVDIMHTWRLEGVNGLKKLKSHYKTALSFLIYLYSFDDSNPDNVQKHDNSFALAKIHAKFPYLRDILIPANAEYCDNILDKISQVEIFTEKISPELLVFDMLESEHEYLLKKLWKNLQFTLTTKFTGVHLQFSNFLIQRLQDLLSGIDVPDDDLLDAQNALGNMIQDLKRYNFDEFCESLNLFRSAMAQIYDDSHVNKPSVAPSLFRERETDETVDILKLLQTGVLKIDQERKYQKLVYIHGPMAPANNEEWDTTILSKFILDLMFLDNSFRGKYNYHNLSQLRNQLISDYTTPWRYNGQDFSFEIINDSDEICTLRCYLNIESYDELIEIKMYIPQIKDIISLIRKVLAKRVSLKEVLDLARIRLEVPDFLLNNPTLRSEVFACLLALVMSRQGNTLMESPKDTHPDSLESERLKNEQNQFSSKGWYMFKVVLRETGEILGRISSDINSVLIETRKGVKEIDTCLLSFLEAEEKQLNENMAMMKNLPQEFQRQLTETLTTQYRERVNRYIESSQHLGGVKDYLEGIYHAANQGTTVDSTLEVQMVAGPSLDDHHQYEWRQILTILKQNIPYHYRTLRICLNLLLFSDFQTCEDIIKPLYKWCLQFTIQGLLDPEVFEQLLNDERVDPRVIKYVLQKVSTSDLEQKELNGVYSEDNQSKVFDLLSHLNRISDPKVI